jgi:hypothetical protein
MLDALRGRARVSESWAAASSVAVMDSRSVRAAETIGRTTHGWDGAKKFTGRKRHIVVDSMVVVGVLVTPASTQGRVAPCSLLRRMRDTAGGQISLVWADGGYTGILLDWARKTLRLVVESSDVRSAVLHRAAQEMGGGTHHVRREALCCIPGSAGRDLEGGSWVEWLTWIRKVKGTRACQKTRRPGPVVGDGAPGGSA